MTDVLKDLVKDPEHQMTEEDARLSEMDLILFQATYESAVRPSLDYLAGYHALEGSDPLRRSTYQGEETWESVLARHGQLSVHKQVVTVRKLHLFCFSGAVTGPNTMLTTVFLTREGKWLLWYVEGQNDRSAVGSRESIEQFDMLADLWRRMTELQFDRYSFSHYGPDGIPLQLEAGLREILDYTIEERQRRLDILTVARDNAAKRVGIVVIPIR